MFMEQNKSLSLSLFSFNWYTFTTCKNMDISEDPIGEILDSFFSLLDQYM